MSSDGWSVRDAATRLLCSEASIRRRIGSDGDLVAVDGAKPLLITRASVEAVQAEMLRQMGVTQSSTEPTPDQTETRLRQLEAENQDLQGALADLTAAHAAVLDTYRRLSAGAIPNR
ncbi:hypothetical protein GCM10023146_23870 [Nocardioides caricicola]